MKTSLFVTSLLLTTNASVGFVLSDRRPTALAASINTSIESSNPSVSALSAKKRRRRKDKAPDTALSDDLPDFDIAEDEEPDLPKKTTTATAANRVVATTEQGEQITVAMMGNTQQQQSTKSVRDLINDRSLEQKLNFDTEDTGDLPDLMKLAQQQQGEGAEPSGKKKARQAARQAAAAARQQEEEDSVQSLLKQVPFLLNEKGEVSAVKILEAGTWAGIGLLVAWEVYINSPFFERAAPVIPVVY